MDITEVSIIHHVGIVLLVLWFLAEFNWCHPVAYFVSLVYLYLVHERYVMRLKKKVQFEERKQANQKRVLTDSETVRWLNHAVEKIWPICMEQIASQKILLPIIPWFLEKYKPWTAKQATVQRLYLGRNPPVFTDMRVLRQSSDDDHLVLELGMNFLTADDMSALLAVKLRKRLGFGMWAKLNITGMHIEGKVLIGVKFLRDWPFLGRLRLCFVEPPYFQMTVKPIFTHGLDVTELPGIAGWLDKLLSIAFEQTLVEPNMLVVDMEKFASQDPENWFSVDEKEPVAHVKVEIVEAADMKPSDLNGLADPYVKGQMGNYRFKTKIQKKTLTPKWLEEFKIPIITWELPNVLALEIRDKDHFVDDILGDCSVSINDLRDGIRHDMWLPLKNIKTGRLHLAVTVLDEAAKAEDMQCDWDPSHVEDKRNSFVNETNNTSSFSSFSSDKSQKVPDNFEPINVEGQKETGIWVHRPGSEVLQTWEPRKGKNRRLDTEILGESNDVTIKSSSLAASGSQNSSSTDEIPDEKNRVGRVRRGLQKISSVFHRSPRKEEPSGSFVESIQSPHVNIKAVNAKVSGIKLVVDEDGAVGSSGEVLNEEDSSSGEGDPESPLKGKIKDKAKNFFKHAEKSARSLRVVLSRKGSRRHTIDSPAVTDKGILADYESSDDESLAGKVERIPVASGVVVPDADGGNDSSSSRDHVVQTSEIDTETDAKSPTVKANPQGLEMLDDRVGEGSPPDSNSDVEPSKLKLDEGSPPDSKSNVESLKLNLDEEGSLEEKTQ
ncbi:C2 domain-containing protein At1g53590-like [Humulus lupulus]|uniref:C2 domain-containing protein At1g53590-like n=1 Tax=Humulus lupulus TaxID=3486 RepID=UPI002B418635|nr:C2 domain-containing protein At1g53590-like [Humulus lupulus]XP_062087213.1 C2 domain-containing protein At1g53590-like [Humulus lupulus]